MANIKIRVFHTGEVCVAPDLPFGGDKSNAIKASGIFGDKSNLTRRLIEKITVYDEKMVVEFRSGLQVEVDA